MTKPKTAITVGATQLVFVRVLLVVGIAWGVDWVEDPEEPQAAMISLSRSLGGASTESIWVCSGES